MVGVVAALTGCDAVVSSKDGSSAGATATASPAGAPGASSAPEVLDAPGGSGAPGASASPGAGEALSSASEIPVGGGRVFDKQKVVVTQPSAGEFKAFGAVCPHAGCVVSTVDNRGIRCPCHGSLFSVSDGSVQRGPATGPLPPRTVVARGGSLFLQ
jgi:nitrite reductase/ring-hydroxylating ferredoxin subunit